jgi:hypothetical protein
VLYAALRSCRRSYPVRFSSSPGTASLWSKWIEYGWIAQQFLGRFQFIGSLGEQPQLQKLGFACCRYGCSGIASSVILQIAIREGKRYAGKARFPLVPPASFQKAKPGSDRGI